MPSSSSAPPSPLPCQSCKQAVGLRRGPAEKEAYASRKQTRAKTQIAHLDALRCTVAPEALGAALFDRWPHALPRAVRKCLSPTELKAWRTARAPWGEARAEQILKGYRENFLHSQRQSATGLVQTSEHTKEARRVFEAIRSLSGALSVTVSLCAPEIMRTVALTLLEKGILKKERPFESASVSVKQEGEEVQLEVAPCMLMEEDLTFTLEPESLKGEPDRNSILVLAALIESLEGAGRVLVKQASPLKVLRQKEDGSSAWAYQEKRYLCTMELGTVSPQSARDAKRFCETDPETGESIPALAGIHYGDFAPLLRHKRPTSTRLS